MPIKLIGKSILGELGFSLNPLKMKGNFEKQLKKVEAVLPWPNNNPFLTSITNNIEVELTKGFYFPKIQKVYPSENLSNFNPRSIYYYCENGKDKYRPQCDFIVWDCSSAVTAITFSREAPIIAFESEKGKALGVILRKSLMKYGDYIFSTIKEELGDNISVSLITCNHFTYPEGSIPSIVQFLSLKYDMSCVVCIDSEKDPDCYHRGEDGNHVVAMW